MVESGQRRGAVMGPRGARVGLCAALVVLVSAGTTGCFDREELEQQAFVTSMGLDKAPGGLLDCTFQIALPKAAGGSSGGGGGGSQPLAAKGPITVRGHSVLEALSLANASVERSLTMTHMDTVIVGEGLARQGVAEAIQPLTRFREFRRTMYLKIAKGTASEVMKSEKPMLETTLTRLADDEQNVGNRTGFAPVQTHFQDLAVSLETPHQAAVLPVYAVNEAVLGDESGKRDVRGKVSYAAGQIARFGGNPVEYIGGAVLQKGKLIDYLNGPQMVDLRMLRGSLGTARMDFSDPNDKGAVVSVSLRRERPPTYRVVVSNPMKIRVLVPLDADLDGVGGRTDYSIPMRTHQLEKSIDAQLSQGLTGMLTHWAKQGIDIVPLSSSIRRRFLTDAQFDHFPWEARLKSARIQVVVNVHIRRFGTQMAPLDVKA